MIFLSRGNHPTISRKSFSITAHKLDEGEKLVQHETSFSWQSKGWISWMMWNEVKLSILHNPYGNTMMKVVHVLISVVRKLAQRGHVAFQFIQLVNINTCCCHCLVAQLCLTLCNPTDCSPQGSSVCGISQTRILEWVAISFSRGSSWPRDRTHISCVTGWFFTAAPLGNSWMP